MNKVQHIKTQNNGIIDQNMLKTEIFYSNLVSRVHSGIILSELFAITVDKSKSRRELFTHYSAYYKKVFYIIGWQIILEFAKVAAALNYLIFFFKFQTLRLKTQYLL